VRFTIERLRTVVLVAGGLLVIALGLFLARGTWKNPFKNRDIPKRLGIDIQQSANGVTYTQSHGGHTLFKMHASKVVQLKNNHAMLHDVEIELYGPDGSRTDRIAGNEFEYDQQTEVARAEGPVEITMMRPETGRANAGGPSTERTTGGKAQSPAPDSRGNLPGTGTGTASGTGPSSDEIHVKTSGLVFDRKTGVATTDRRVDFSVTQGTGNSIGATFDSTQGQIVLDSKVELNVWRNGELILVHAGHAEFERGDMVCHMRAATASFREGQATAGEAKILFREDGTAVRLDASGGFTLATSTGGQLGAPTGWLAFNEKNQPQHGHLEGGVTLDSVTHTASNDRRSHGTSPTAEIEFTQEGQLRHAHMERGVQLTSEEQSDVEPGPLMVTRTWRSPVADVEFRDAGDGNQVEPAWIHGVDGVVITGESQRGNGPRVPSRLTADDVKVDFGPGSKLNDMTGIGHASMEETTAAGTYQTSRGDRLEAHFFAQPANGEAAGAEAGVKNTGGRQDAKNTGGAGQIETATLEGNVAIAQQPAGKAGAPAGAPIQATAGRADYEGAGERVHLTDHPRVDQGGLQLTADKIDMEQASGDAFAHGNVKATWLQNAQDGPVQDRPTQGKTAQDKPAQAGQSSNGAVAQPVAGLGGRGPTHAVASEAQMHQATGEATFRGNARLWQESDSVAAPVIVLNRQNETLTATSTDAGDPVHVVMVSASAPDAARKPSRGGDSKQDPSQVIRASGGALKYSDAERKAVMTAGTQGVVVAETPTARSVSDELELKLLPAGNHAGKDGGAAQVDTMTANGHVVVTSQGRRGTGTQLVYSGESGEYVLRGSAGAPPRMTDPLRGSVTGEALIFHSRDDSVSIEGGGGETVTETRTPK
jgi:lipopolysaccharide export system protein LptA